MKAAPGYSPLLQIWYVYVPENYIPNTIKSYATLEQAAGDYYTTVPGRATLW